MNFFELEVVSEFADERLVLAMFIVEILALNTRKVPLYVSNEKYGKSKRRTQNFARNYDVVLTTSKQWMWRRQRQDDGGLQSAFQVLRMTGMEINFRYAVVVPPVVVLKVSTVARATGDKVTN